VPVVIIRDRIGREIHRIEGARDLVGANLKDLNLAHADLAGQSLFGANCEGTILIGALLDRTDFSRACLRGSDLYLSSVLGTGFCHADMRGASLYKAETGWPFTRKYPSADLTEALVDESSDIPGRKFCGTMRVR